MQIEYTQEVVEIFYHRQRIASHQRDGRPGKYTTIKKHLASTHRYYASWNAEFFAKRGAAIGPEVETYITKLIAQYAYPELGYKQAQGILSLVKAYGRERLIRACQMGLMASRYNYQIIANILKNRMDEQPADEITESPHIPQHTNIRGAKAYQ